MDIKTTSSELRLGSYRAPGTLLDVPIDRIQNVAPADWVMDRHCSRFPQIFGVQIVLAAARGGFTLLSPTVPALVGLTERKHLVLANCFVADRIDDQAVEFMNLFGSEIRNVHQYAQTAVAKALRSAPLLAWMWDCIATTPYEAPSSVFCRAVGAGVCSHRAMSSWLARQPVDLTNCRDFREDWEAHVTDAGGATFWELVAAACRSGGKGLHGRFHRLAAYLSGGSVDLCKVRRGIVSMGLSPELVGELPAEADSQTEAESNGA